MRIYVAGPYSPQEDYFHTIIQKASQNVDKAIQVGIELIEKGHEPFVPHLTHYIHTHRDAQEYGEWWYEYDLTFIEHWAQAIYMMDDWEESKGAKQELEVAKENGLNVYFDLGEIPEVDNDGQNI